MRIACIGGGPAGLYAAILFKLRNRDHEVTVYERNRADDTFGFGVVFSDATLGNLEAADPQTLAAIRSNFAHWDAIDTHVGGSESGEIIRSVGHGFCGLERKRLLLILKERAEELGVVLHFSHPLDAEAVAALAAEVDLVIAADGVGSQIRDQYAREFGPDVVMTPNRFVWLGTTFPFKAFTFYFKDAPEGLWRIHAYRYTEGGSTFIAECTAQTLVKAGLSETDEEATIAHLEAVFADELAGHPLIKNRSHWRRFPNVRNTSWSAGNIVLVGDAAHTAHFSIGSGTKLAMEDGIALADALGDLRDEVTPTDVSAGLQRYEEVRRPVVERLQDAALVSLEWFEETERYIGYSPLAFTYSLLTRSLRVTHESLTVRDGAFADAALADWTRENHGGLAADEKPAPAHTQAFDLYGKRAQTRVASLTSNALVVEGLEPIPFGDPSDGALCAVRIFAEDVVANAAELDGLADAHARPVVVVISRDHRGDKVGAREVARACDAVRHRIGVPVVAVIEGGPHQFSRHAPFSPTRGPGRPVTVSSLGRTITCAAVGLFASSALKDTNARADTPCDNASAQVLASALHNHLVRETERLRSWRVTWTAIFAGSTIGQITLANLAEENERPVFYVGAVKAALGAVTTPFLSPHGASVAVVPGESGCDQLVRLRGLLALTARREAKGMSWLAHLSGVAVNLAGVLYLGLAHDQWVDGLLGAAIGGAVGELKIWTQPRRAIDWAAEASAGPMPNPELSIVFGGSYLGVNMNF